MSRVGKQPIKIESGVKVAFNAPTIEVTGKSGKLTREIPSCLNVEVKGEEILLSVKDEKPETKALHGLTRTLVSNMVHGVSQGYSKVLELRGVGYRAAAKGSTLNLSLGFSHPVEFELPEGMTAKVEANTKVTLTAADKEQLGATAAKIRKIRPPEPYKGKGIRYLGEHIVMKQGKAAGGK